jgi:hypothetical protein
MTKNNEARHGGGVGFFEIFAYPGEYHMTAEERKGLVATALSAAALSLEREEARKKAAEEAGYPPNYNPWKSSETSHGAET